MNKITEKLDPIFISKSQGKDYYISQITMVNKINNVYIFNIGY